MEEQAVAARVVVVQPREALARLAVAQLAAAGMEALVVTDPIAARRLLDEPEPPDALVVDLTLPLLDGWYALSALGDRSAVTVVAYGPIGDAARARRLGAAACVADRAEVAAAVHRAVDRSRPVDAA
jgi:DNA-binding response OmpR family regulator